MTTILKAAGYEADTISADTLRRAVSKVKIARATSFKFPESLSARRILAGRGTWLDPLSLCLVVAQVPLRCPPRPADLAS